jgi:hypothetical protein
MSMKTQRNAAVGAATLFVGKHLARKKAKRTIAQNLWVKVGAVAVAVAGAAGALAVWKTRSAD